MKHLELMSIVNSKSDRSNTGYKGISHIIKRNKYQSILKFTSSGGIKNNFHIGYFNTLEEAIEARKNFILNLL